MAEPPSDFPDESSEAATLVRLVAEPRTVDDSVKAAIRRAARRLGWSFSRTRGVWYRDARRVTATEMDQLRARVRRDGEEASRDDLAELKARIQRIEQIIEETLPEASASRRLDLGRIVARLLG